jgi:signal peptidase II
MKLLNREKALPFLLTAFVVAADQLSKAYVAKHWAITINYAKPFAEYFGDFLQFYHVRNKAIAFSLGQNLPDAWRPIVFIVLPALVLLFLFWYYIASRDFTRLQRWAVAGILGGGLGNIIDRIFRTEGVIDFVSVKFYGIFGFERWPTFNIADATVVVCSLILLVSMLIPHRAEEKDARSKAPAKAPPQAAAPAGGSPQ